MAKSVGNLPPTMQCGFLMGTTTRGQKCEHDRKTDLRETCCAWKVYGAGSGSNNMAGCAVKAAAGLVSRV
jgi:hypothetical protein